MSRIYLLFAFLILVFPCSASAITVDNDGSADFDNIQAAIDSSINGDTIIVQPGIYTGNGNRDIDFKGKAITVQSTDPNDPNVVSNTVIDCQSSPTNLHRGFRFDKAETQNSILDGLTIINGCAPLETYNGSNYDGGAIFCRESSPTISKCRLIGNSSINTYSNGGGGGICIIKGTPLITQCTFMNNSAEYGAGIYCQSSAVIKYCTFLENTGRVGAGILSFYYNPVIEYCSMIKNNGHGFRCTSGNPQLRNCCIIGNAKEGISSDCATTSIINCTIVDNSIALYCDCKIPVVSNCILWNKGSSEINGSCIVTYSDVKGGFSGEGNINRDPLLIDSLNADYHLAAQSPCIEAGDPNYVTTPGETDIDGDFRVINSRIDMGADEFNEGAPVIRVSPRELYFSSYKGQDNPEPETLTIQNIGTGTINWEVTDDCSWLSADPYIGASSGEVNETTVNIDTSGLSPGLHICQTAIAADGAINSPRIVTITLELLEPVIETAQSAIEFINGEGKRVPNNQILSIRNSGTGVLNWSIQEDCAWLNVHPADGESSGETDEVLLSADIAGQAPGDYYSSLTITGQYAPNSPQTIPIHLHISNPYINYSPNVLKFAVSPLTTNLHKVLFISNGGGGTLEWQLVTDCNWLDIVPQDGNTTDEIDEVIISVNPDGLEAGDHNGTVTIFANNASNNPQNVQILIHIHGNGAEVLYVPEQFYTIQEAIDVALDGDTIVVAEGVYSGAGNRDLDFAGKAITVRSTDPNDPNIVAATIIDCNGTAEEPHGGFYFHSGEDGNSILKGLTVKNGYVSNGGGVYCGGASPTISNCNFIDCSAENWGGGVYCYEASPIISECNFTGNSAREGGAITTYSYWDITCSPLIKNCTMSGNYGSTDGGAFDSDCLSSPILSNCTIINNHSGSLGGGGIAIWQSTPTIQNCVIADNYTDGQGSGILQAYEFGDGSKIINCVITQSTGYNNYGPGIYCSSKMLVKNSILGGNTDLFPGGIIASSGSDVNFAYCDAINSGGSGPSWHVPMVKDGGGNIDAEPQFANTLNNDYHLKSAAGRWDPNSKRWVKDSITSPCIDTGDTNSDWTAELWPHGKRINIGAYGGTAEASMSLSALGNIANLDNDPEEIVDIFDIAIFASQWCLRDMPLSADIDRNGRVDFIDFARLGQVFAANIGIATNPQPSNGQQSVSAHPILAWSTGTNVVAHNVYFGIDFDEVSNADVTDFGVYMGNQDANYWNTNNYAPALQFNTTYYWRIDEVAPINTIKGHVWSFKTTIAPPSNWWMFDEAGGTRAIDSADHSDGHLIGGLVRTNGKIGRGLQFDGINDYIDCGSGPSNYDNITVCAWMKTSTQGTLVSNRFNSSGYGTWYTLSSASIELGDNSQGGYKYLTFNTPTLDGVWHYIVYTKNGTNHAVYVNGSLDQSFTSNADISQNVPLFIGRSLTNNSGINWFNGIIDNVRIYNRALSADEVAQLFEEIN